MKKVFFITLLALLLNACNQSNFLTDEDISEIDFSSASTSYSIAENYYQNKIKLDQMTTERNVSSSSFPSFLYDLDIEDKEGNPVSFSELSDNEKSIFFSVWKKESIQQLAEKLSSDTDAAKATYINNQLFNSTLLELNRSVASIDISTFLKKLSQKRKAYANTISQQRSSSGSSSLTGKITEDCYNPVNAQVLSNCYRPGRILVTADASNISSSDVGLGHASLVGNIDITKIEKLNGTTSFSISSYPKDVKPDWDGKTNGVQYEPLGLWAGNKEGAIRNVRLYDMQKNKWVWDWFNSGYKKFDAPIQDYYTAANYAESKLGKPYFLNPIKDNEDSFYCSQLVWKSWRQIDRNYDMSCGFAITPEDIINAAHTKRVTAFTNY